ncbi:hypothetical protein PC110_g21420, partial [Phytophthora cactorum]
YNLAVQRFLREHEGLLENMNALVGQLRTKKNGARLRQYTELVAVKSNTTRWSYTFKMLKRYLEIKAAAKQVETVEDLVPRARAHRKIEKFCEQMRALESVNKKLQSEETTMADARVLFDGVLQLYPTMKSHLSKEVHIVHSPDFENGIVKGWNGGELTEDEAAAIASLRTEGAQSGAGSNDDTSDLGFAESLLHAG